jgi:hypothetical protein
MIHHGDTESTEKARIYCLLSALRVSVVKPTTPLCSIRGYNLTPLPGLIDERPSRIFRILWFSQSDAITLEANSHPFDLSALQLGRPFQPTGWPDAFVAEGQDHGDFITAAWSA